MWRNLANGPFDLASSKNMTATAQRFTIICKSKEFDNLLTSVSDSWATARFSEASAISSNIELLCINRENAADPSNGSISFAC